MYIKSISINNFKWFKTSAIN